MAQVTPDERRRFQRQVEALRAEETHDEGTAQWRAEVVERANERRAARGMAPLQEWWEVKGELELHRRARALGLLD